MIINSVSLVIVTSIMPDRNKSPYRKKVKKNNNKMDTPSSETSRRSSATASSGVSIKGYGSETSSIIPPVIRLKVRTVSCNSLLCFVYTMCFDLVISIAFHSYIV